MAKTSDYLPDDDVHSWFIYRKPFKDGLNDLSGQEEFVDEFGDIYHTIGEVLEYFKMVRRTKAKDVRNVDNLWVEFTLNPFCFTVWGRLTTDLDEYRLYYIATLGVEEPLITIYSCWPSEEENHYHLYRWRAEYKGEVGHTRKYRKIDLNYRGYYHIPPMWPSWKNAELVWGGQIKKYALWRIKDEFRGTE